MPGVQRAIWKRYLFLPKTEGKKLARACLRSQGYHGSGMGFHQGNWQRNPKDTVQDRDSSDGVGWCVCVCACVDVDVHTHACPCVNWKFILCGHSNKGCWEILIILSFSFGELQLTVASTLPTRILFCLQNSLEVTRRKHVPQSQGISAASPHLVILM